MGLFGLLSLIPTFSGDYGRALCMLAFDYVDTANDVKLSEENRRIEEHNRKYCIAPSEYTRMIAWAIGEENLGTFTEFTEYHGIEIAHELTVTCWNKRHGHTLRLYSDNGAKHNFKQIANLWISVGKP